MKSAEICMPLNSLSHFTLRMLAAAVALVFVLQLAACNTVEGAGEDIEEAGESIEDAAD